jgi:modulator of FtsH protease HflC
MKKILIIIGVLIVAIYVSATVFVAVDESEIVVITEFGNPVRTIEQAGLALKWPDPFQTVVRLDKRLQALNSDPGEFLTNDKKNIVVSNFILWKIADAKKLLQTVRDFNSAQRRLSDLVSSEIGVAIGSFELSSFLTTEPEGTQIPAMMKSVVEVSREQARDEFGIEIVDVRLRYLGFPYQNLRSVYDRMKTDRERIAKKYRAEGEEEAAKVRAQTDREVRELLADTYRDAQIIRGQGDAESIRIYAKAFKKDPKFYKLTRTLEAYKKFLDNNTTLILSSEAPLFRYLENPPR